jgi:hypothetical protein
MMMIASTTGSQPLLPSVTYTLLGYEGFQEIFSSTPLLLGAKYIYLGAVFCRRLTVQRILEMFPNADSFALDLDDQMCNWCHTPHKHPFDPCGSIFSIPGGVCVNPHSD